MAKGDRAMHRHFPRHLISTLVAGAALLLAATAFGAGSSVTLNLKRGYRNQERAACAERHHYTLYHRSGRLEMDGYVSPAPALPDGTWRVKVKIKQCRGGRFVAVWQRHARGNGVLLNGVKVGHFRITYRMRHKGFFFARAYYYGYKPRIRSDEEHFRVTR
jgi:hypothetical protein